VQQTNIYNRLHKIGNVCGKAKNKEGKGKKMEVDAEKRWGSGGVNTAVADQVLGDRKMEERRLIILILTLPHVLVLFLHCYIPVSAA